MFSMLTS